MSSLHRTELEVKLNGLQELMELKKTIYEQVKMQSGEQPWHTHKLPWKKKKSGILVDSSTTERALFWFYTKMRACPGESHGVTDNY